MVSSRAFARLFWTIVFPFIAALAGGLGAFAGIAAAKALRILPHPTRRPRRSEFFGGDLFAMDPVR